MKDYIIEISLAVMAALGGLFAYLRSGKGSAALKSFLSIFTGSSNSEAIESALNNLAKVVDAQGQSIEWLMSELETTKQHLQEAREALKKREDELQSENAALKSRIAELETQVQALEQELNRRKKYTRKDYR